MKVSALSLSAIIGVAASVSFAFADVPIQKAPVIAALPAKLSSPIALDAAKRSVKFGAALKGAGLVTATPPPSLEMKLTPVQPKPSAGVEITRAGTGLFEGSQPGEPDGSYTLMRGGGMLATSTIEMRFPTEANKFYLFLCKARVPNGVHTRILYTRSGSNGAQPLAIDDGYLIGAFQASATQTSLSIMMTPSPEDTSAVLGYFYGCEIGKA